MSNITTARRYLKNTMYNYSTAEVLVRKATSNDKWGPSSTQMWEISDLTYDRVKFNEVMATIWRRLDDRNKNWRHVYKALILLEYLIKAGSPEVSDHARRNLPAVETLRDFQHFEEHQDCGLNVRERSKQICALLRDEAALAAERVKTKNTHDKLRRNAPANQMNGGVNAASSSRHHHHHHQHHHHHRGGGGRPLSMGAMGGARSTSMSNLSAVGRSSAGGGGGVGGGAAMSGGGESSIAPKSVNEEKHQMEIAMNESKLMARKLEQQQKIDDENLKLALEISRKDSLSKKRISGAQSLHAINTLQDDVYEEVTSSSPPHTTVQWSGVHSPRKPTSPRSPGEAAKDAFGNFVQPAVKTTTNSAAGDTLFGDLQDPWGAAAPPSSLPPPDDAMPFSGGGGGGGGGGGAPANNFQFDECFVAPSFSVSKGVTKSVSSADTNPLDDATAVSKEGGGGAVGNDASKAERGSSISSKNLLEGFLGQNANLVDLDRLIKKPLTSQTAANQSAIGMSANQESYNLARHRKERASENAKNPFGPIRAHPTALNSMALSSNLHDNNSQHANFPMNSPFQSFGGGNAALLNPFGAPNSLPIAPQPALPPTPPVMQSSFHPQQHQLHHQPQQQQQQQHFGAPKFAVATPLVPLAASNKTNSASCSFLSQIGGGGGTSANLPTQFGGGVGGGAFPGASSGGAFHDNNTQFGAAGGGMNGATSASNKSTNDILKDLDDLFG